MRERFHWPRMLFFQAASSPRGHFSLPAASSSGKYSVGVLVESTKRGLKAPVKDLTCLRGLCGLPIVQKRMVCYRPVTLATGIGSPGEDDGGVASETRACLGRGVMSDG
jgi:hypothetical protein